MIVTENGLSPEIWSVQVPGKWILAGEHAVLRGCPAIVFPLKSRYLKLSYQPHRFDFSIKISGLCSSDLELIIWSVFEKAIQNLGKTRSDFKGTLEIESHIQFGAGMGASATLAVGMTLFFKHLGFLQSDTFTFAKMIEDLFHGESSGVDVAVALHQKAMIFEKNKENIFFEIPDLPKLYLSYTGQRGVTKDCVAQVKSLIAAKPDYAHQIDSKMKSVVDKFIQNNYHLNFDQWIDLLNTAQSCFDQWNLVPVNVQKHFELLKDHGAKAYKLTGSGQGGYVLSLWHETPQDQNFLAELIPVSGTVT